MSGVIKLENVKELIIKVRGQEVLLDSDVAQIYGVETRDINKAVTNNPDKFPVGYVIELSKPEKNELVENFHRFDKLKHSTANPKAFTEKGLYMLATILKSPQAIQATLSIIETFSKIRELSRNIKELSAVQDKAEQKSLMQKSGCCCRWKSHSGNSGLFGCRGEVLSPSFVLVGADSSALDPRMFVVSGLLCYINETERSVVPAASARFFIRWSKVANSVAPRLDARCSASAKSIPASTSANAPATAALSSTVTCGSPAVVFSAFRISFCGIV